MCVCVCERECVCVCMGGGGGGGGGRGTGLSTNKTATFDEKGDSKKQQLQNVQFHTTLALVILC